MEELNVVAEAEDTIRELLLVARELAGQKKLQYEEAVKVEKTWLDLSEYINKKWPIHIVHFMEKESLFFKQIRSENPKAISNLEYLYKLSKEAAENIRRRFPTLIAEACKASGMIINPESRHPKYYFEGNYFTLEINDQRLMARLSDNEGLLHELPADIEAVIQLLQREHKRIFGRKFDGKKFIEKLRRNYLAALTRNKLNDGASVPIRNITRRLGKNEKGFRTDEFIVDLSRLVESGPFTIDGRILDLQQTKDTHQGILLHGQASRGYIGFIIFGKVEQ